MEYTRVTLYFKQSLLDRINQIVRGMRVYVPGLEIYKSVSRSSVMEAWLLRAVEAHEAGVHGGDNGEDIVGRVQCNPVDKDQ